MENPRGARYFVIYCLICVSLFFQFVFAFWDYCISCLLGCIIKLCLATCVVAVLVKRICGCFIEDFVVLVELNVGCITGIYLVFESSVVDFLVYDD